MTDHPDSIMIFLRIGVHIMKINFIFFVSIFYVSHALACSERGKQEYKLDNKLAANCAAIAQEVALQIGNATFPSLKPGGIKEESPHSPFKALGLEPRAQLKISPSATIEKKKHQNRQAIFNATISTNQGNWECLYCVTFEIEKDRCKFKHAAIHHCAGGVSYPQ